MDFPTILFIAFALAMDAFAVALSAGAYLVKADRRQTFRLSFHFGLFQFLMPVIGWYAGAQFISVLGKIDHWLALLLLGAIGVKMMRDSRREEGAVKSDVTKGSSLIGLSVATSIDAFAVGLSLGVLRAGVYLPSVIIGIVAAGMTILGLRLGERFSARLGRKMEFAGGAILILIGLRILAEHLS
jgi:manganese efflux pump family protein